MRRPARSAALVGLLLVPVLAGGFVWQERATRDGARLFDQVVSLIGGQFVDTLSTAELYERAARGLVAQLQDPYSELLSPQQLSDFNRNTGGRYGGIGMQIEDQQGQVVVSRVFPNTPAEGAGVQEGDRIVRVDTASTRGWRLQQVSSALLGTPGTKVKVTFARPGVSEPINLELTRAVVHIPAVPYGIVFDGGIGYIPLQQFNETAAQEVAQQVRRLKREGATRFVLDLRGNPGGYLDQSLVVANLFLPKGDEIASVRGRGDLMQRYVADRPPLDTVAPLVVLTDGFSASASEIVAGALQDHDRAVVVGTTSFGKGLVQTLFNLDGGYALKMTTAKWFTPAGRTIQKPRTVGPDGRFIETPPDSAESDSSRAARPTYRTDAGRTVLGGGGIVPDVVVRPDTFTTAEQQFLRAIAPKSQEIYVQVYDLAFSLKGKVAPDFTLAPEWRRDLEQRILASGAKVDTAQLRAGRRYLDRLLEQRIARLAFGDSAAKRRDLADDVQLARALELLRTSRTQGELFARAASSESASR
jgi:carboxyl-terminal processing protease